MSKLSALQAPAIGVVQAPRPSAPAQAALASGVPANDAPVTKPHAGQAKTVAQSLTVASKADELEKLVAEMQRKTATLSSDLQFSIDKETGKDIIKVTDRETKSVVWQFPSEEALQITRALDQYQKGLVLSRTA